MRIVFMGTPESAVPSLRRLLADGHEIVAVWTQPDKPAGRGNKLHQSPVKEFASQRNLTIHQPFKIKTKAAKALFSSHRADAAIVVAYGKILPAEFLNAPRHGGINVHFSLLPKYRGAAPVNWAIVNGEKETGVTTMKIIADDLMSTLVSMHKITRQLWSPAMQVFVCHRIDRIRTATRQLYIFAARYILREVQRHTAARLRLCFAKVYATSIDTWRRPRLKAAHI